jgi:hypothetical protein
MEKELNVASLPLLGFRRWKIDSRLKSLIAYPQFSWTNKTLQATCLSRKRHQTLPYRPPELTCHCGIHAYHSLEDAVRIQLEETADPYMFPKNWLIGAVMAWGKIVIHKKGFRSEFQQIIALGQVDFTNPEELNMAKLYDVPLIPISKIEYYGKEFAQSWKGQLV